MGFDELLNRTVRLSDSGQLNSAALWRPKLLNSTEQHIEQLNSTIKYSDHVAIRLTQNLFGTAGNRSNLGSLSLVNHLAFSLDPDTHKLTIFRC